MIQCLYVQEFPYTNSSTALKHLEKKPKEYAEGYMQALNDIAWGLFAVPNIAESIMRWEGERKNREILAASCVVVYLEQLNLPAPLVH